MTPPTLAPASVPTAVYAAARSHAHGPTVALWHAVQLHAAASEVTGACEVTLCGTLVRLEPNNSWPTQARDTCPTCITLAR